MHVLLAPDKFKGSLSAAQVAEAMARGVQRGLPSATARSIPLADGGEGSADCLRAGLGGVTHLVPVDDPLGRTIGASLTVLRDGRAVVEVAAASGLALVAPEHRDALRASSRGAGQLVGAALQTGVRSLVVAVGGSASSDGGTGAAAALGWRFLDALGRELPPGGGALVELRRIDGDRVDERLRAAQVLGACDVGNELLGPRGAAGTFGPQKGASASEVQRLEEGLARLAERTRADLGVELSRRWGAGAGGGMGAGLLAFFGAELHGGFDLVADTLRLHGEVARADIVITGEGKLDHQTSGGKVPAGVARLAGARGVPCIAIAGEVMLPPQELQAMGFAGVASLLVEEGPDRSFGDPAGALAEVTERVLRREFPR